VADSQSSGKKLSYWVSKGLIGWAVAILAFGFTVYRSHVDDARFAEQQARAEKAEHERDSGQKEIAALRDCIQGQRASLEDFLSAYKRHLADLRIASSKLAEVRESGTEAARKATGDYVAAAKALVQFIREWRNVQGALAKTIEGTDVVAFERATDSGDTQQIEQARLELEHTSADKEMVLDRALREVQTERAERVCGRL